MKKKEVQIMFNAETITQMSSWNTVITFFLLVSLCCAGIGYSVSTILDGIVLLVKALAKRIRRKGESAHEDSDTEHRH